MEVSAMKKNRSMVRRSAPSPLVMLAGAALFMALVALVLWPRNLRPKAQQGALNLQRASVHAPQQATPMPARAQENGSDEKSQAPAGSVRILRGKITGPLAHSIRRAGLDSKDVDFLDSVAGRLLIWRLDTRRDLQKGDTFEILYQTVDTQSRFEILAMRYQSKKHQKKYSFYRYQEPGKRFAAYYDETGKEIELKLKNSPLREYDQVTSILKMRPKHKGVDFKTPVGTKLYMPFRGKITRTTWNFRYNGNCLEVMPLHKPNIRILFLHLDKLPEHVKVGKIYPAGAVIGATGNTGRSTAPHLHYQIQTPQGRIFDPFQFHETYTRSLPAAHQDAFQQHRRALDKQF
jgi:murein DD-endopeptidase MepM/ murein hydrolase activator NlpD